MLWYSRCRLVLGSLLILGALAGLVLNAIKEAGRTTVSESVQKIIINYLQVAALFGNFPLRWVRNIFTDSLFFVLILTINRSSTIDPFETDF